MRCLRSIAICLSLTIAGSAYALQAAATSDGPAVSAVSVSRVRFSIPTDDLDAIAFHPAGRRLYGTHRSSTPVAGEVVVFDWGARTEIARIQTGWFADDIVVHPDGTRAYVALASGIGVVDVATNTLAAVLPIVDGGYHVAIDATGAHVLATGFLNADGVSHGYVSMIDTTTDQVVRTGELPYPVIDAALAPDGDRAYVSAFIDGIAEIVIVDTATLTEIGRVTPAPTYEVSAVAVHPSGAELYVSVCSPSPEGCSGDSGAVLVIDTTTATVRTTLPVTSPSGLAVDPRGKILLVSGDAMRSFRLGCQPTLKRTVAVGTSGSKVSIRPVPAKRRPLPPCP